MISIDQVLLLQQKVESAVQKIVELKAENDALRTKCSELTNALSSKTEQLSTIEVDQNQIEDSILGALDRLNKIENSVLSQAGQNTALKSEAAPLPATNNESDDVAAPEFDLDVSTDDNSDQDSDEKEEKFDIF